VFSNTEVGLLRCSILRGFTNGN